MSLLHLSGADSPQALQGHLVPSPLAARLPRTWDEGPRATCGRCLSAGLGHPLWPCQRCVKCKVIAGSKWTALCARVGTAAERLISSLLLLLHSMGWWGKLFKTCLLWIFSPFWGACPDLRLQDLIEVPHSRSFN